jgi:hypothetical protein
MTEKHHVAGNSSIVPAMAGKMQDNFDNSFVMGNGAIEGEGFIRLATEELCRNPIEIIKRVMLQGTRFVLQQAGEDVAAIITEAEFYRLYCAISNIKGVQFLPDEELLLDEEEIYEYESGISCINLEDFLENFDNVLDRILEDGEVFGLLATEDMGDDVDLFMPVAIVMSVNRFWVPDYVIAERRAMLGE